MRKIPMLFEMKFDDLGNRIIANKVSDRARAALLAGEARATWKRDGTAAMLDEAGNWFMRRAVKPGKKAPEGFIALETDPNTNITFGWEPAAGTGFAKFWRAAIAEGGFAPGTFELVAPKINGNPEGVDAPKLIPHGSELVEGVPDVEDILDAEDPIGLLRPLFEGFKDNGVEGIVWWVDGVPVVKLRAKDFFPEMDSRFRR